MPILGEKILEVKTFTKIEGWCAEKLNQWVKPVLCKIQAWIPRALVKVKWGLCICNSCSCAARCEPGKEKQLETSEPASLVFTTTKQPRQPASSKGGRWRANPRLSSDLHVCSVITVHQILTYIHSHTSSIYPCTHTRKGGGSKQSVGWGKRE